jgi:hypothetical protein
MAATYCYEHNRSHENDVDCPDCALHAAQHALCEAAVAYAMVAIFTKSGYPHSGLSAESIALGSAVDAYTALRGKETE